MQLRPLSHAAGRIDSRPPPPWVRVRCSAIGLAADFQPSRRGLGEIVLAGEALLSGDLTVHLQGHGTIVVPVSCGDTAADTALELASRILTETRFDACVRTRGAGFAVALGEKAELV